MISFDKHQQSCYKSLQDSGPTNIVYIRVNHYDFGYTDYEYSCKHVNINAILISFHSTVSALGYGSVDAFEKMQSFMPTMVIRGMQEGKVRNIRNSRKNTPKRMVH